MPQNPELPPAEYNPDHVPARVSYLDSKRASVTHPLGNDHINAIRTRRRLLKRGYVIVPFVAPAAENRTEAMRAAAGGG